MLRINLFLLTLNFIIGLNAQSYIGFGADNFNGVHGVVTNPANIADSRTKVDINLASASAFGVNNYIEFNYWDALTDEDYSFSEQANVIGATDKTFGATNIDVLGPSVMVSLNEKHSFALTTRFRSLANFNNADGEVIELLRDDNINETDPFFLTEVNTTIATNNWVEFGATYARVLKNDKIHFTKAGISIKYIKSYGGGTATINDATFLNDPSNTNLFASGTANYNLSDNFDSNNNGTFFESADNYEFESVGTSLGLDLGFIYEYRPQHRKNISKSNVKEQIVIRHKSTYKYKIGASILDIGSISYNTIQKNYSFGNIDINTIINGDFIDDIEPVFLTNTEITKTKIKLPTRLRLEFDLLLKEKFYLNTVTNLSLISKKAKKANRYVNQISISPRYETKWFTAFSPITLTQHGGVQWGAGARLGPLFIGSSGLFSRVIDNKTRAFDIYAGLKIPIFHKTPPSTEEDDDEPFRSNCTDCIEKDKGPKAKRLEGYKGAVK